MAPLPPPLPPPPKEDFFSSLFLFSLSPESGPAAQPPHTPRTPCSGALDRASPCGSLCPGSPLREPPPQHRPGLRVPPPGRAARRGPPCSRSGHHHFGTRHRECPSGRCSSGPAGERGPARCPSRRSLLSRRWPDPRFPPRIPPSACGAAPEHPSPGALTMVPAGGQRWGQQTRYGSGQHRESGRPAPARVIYMAGGGADGSLRLAHWL